MRGITLLQGIVLPVGNQSRGAFPSSVSLIQKPPLIIPRSSQQGSCYSQNSSDYSFSSHSASISMSNETKPISASKQQQHQQPMASCKSASGSTLSTNEPNSRQLSACRSEDFTTTLGPLPQLPQSSGQKRRDRRIFPELSTRREKRSNSATAIITNGTFTESYLSLKTSKCDERSVIHPLQQASIIRQEKIQSQECSSNTDYEYLGDRISYFQPPIQHQQQSQPQLNPHQHSHQASSITGLESVGYSIDSTFPRLQYSSVGMVCAHPDETYNEESIENFENQLEIYQTSCEYSQDLLGESQEQPHTFKGSGRDQPVTGRFEQVIVSDQRWNNDTLQVIEEVDKLRKICEDQDKEMDKFHRLVEELKKEKQVLVNENMKIAASNAILQEEMKKLRKSEEEIRRLHSILEEKEKLLISEKEESQKERRMLETTIEENLKSLEEIQREHRAREVERKQHEHKLQADIMRMRSELSLQAVECETLNKVCEELTCEIARMKVLIDSTQRDVSTGVEEIQRLRDERNTLEEDLSMATEQTRDYKAKYSILKKKYIDLQAATTVRTHESNGGRRKNHSHEKVSSINNQQQQYYHDLWTQSATDWTQLNTQSEKYPLQQQNNSSEGQLNTQQQQRSKDNLYY